MAFARPQHGQHGQSGAADKSTTYWVITMLPPESVRELRVALQGVRPITMIVSEAARWPEHADPSLRGKRYRGSSPLVRIEIQCEQRHLNEVAHAITQVSAQRPKCHAFDGMVTVLPHGDASELSPRDLPSYSERALH
jgi:nitrogen regulatory protein PII